MKSHHTKFKMEISAADIHIHKMSKAKNFYTRRTFLCLLYSHLGPEGFQSCCILEKL